jgi:heme-degrading monooxygenase HmoA
MSGFHLAQFNVTRLVEPIEAPRSAEFRKALARVNALAEASPGFVWRAKGAGFDSEIPAQDVDPMILANLSVWESAEALAAFAYRSAHGQFVKRRERWFEPAAEAYQAMWWIPAGTLPTRAEAFARLERLRAEGASAQAFDFRTRFPAPAPMDPIA